MSNQWNAVETALLQVYAHDETRHELADRFNRTISSIDAKLSRLGAHAKGYTVPVPQTRRSGRTVAPEGDIKLHIKRGETRYRIKINGRWVSYFNHLYTMQHGAIPAGHIVVPKDGNWQNTAPENIGLVSRKEHAYHSSQKVDMAARGAKTAMTRKHGKKGKPTTAFVRMTSKLAVEIKREELNDIGKLREMINRYAGYPVINRKPQG